MTEISRVNTPVADSDVQALPAIEPDFDNNQVLTNDGTAQVTASAVGSQMARIYTEVPVHFRFGETPTATTADPIIPAGTVEYFKIDPTHKVSTIRPASAVNGDTHVTPALEA